MILEIDIHRSHVEPMKNLIYLDFFATAPWNRPKLKNPPDYKGVGIALFIFAVSRSFDLEYNGRVGLHSLPAAESFYQKIEMNDFGCDPNYENLRYFELSINVALEIIKIKN